MNELGEEMNCHLCESDKSSFVVEDAFCPTRVFKRKEHVDCHLTSLTKWTIEAKHVKKTLDIKRKSEQSVFCVHEDEEGFSVLKKNE